MVAPITPRKRRAFTCHRCSVPLKSPRGSNRKLLERGPRRSAISHIAQTQLVAGSGIGDGE